MATIRCRYYKEAECDLKMRDFNPFDCEDVDNLASWKPCTYAEAKAEDADLRGTGCKHMFYPRAEFEKTVKNYELDDSGLTIGKQFIYIDDIDFLQIDGKEIKINERRAPERIVWE